MRAATLLALLPFAAAAPSKRSSPAPVIAPRGASLIEGKYIVRMKSDAISTASESAISSIEADADYHYKQGFQGFAASLTPKEVEKMQNDPNVDFLEQDAVVTISATQKDAPWGIARLSNKEPGSTTYTYDDTAGEGTCAFVVDTGIDITHPEFEGRAKWSNNFADKNNRDGQGHGTHVSGTIGSKTYGVAKKTNLFAVKVLGDDGSGTNSGVIKGMEWVVDQAPKEKCPKGVVVNMSLGGGFSQAVNQAAAAITKAGLFLAVAAGNDAANAGQSSPASEASACTVGASDSEDKIAEFSNFGKAVDVFAPGVKVLSTFPDGKTDTLDGTSMASPHITGLGAYFLGTGVKAEGLCDHIAKTGLQGVVSGVPNGTANVLANNGEGQ